MEIKAHIEIDAASDLSPSPVTAEAYPTDTIKTTELLHGKEDLIYVDTGYSGVEKWTEIQELSQDIHWKRYEGFNEGLEKELP